MHRWGPGRRAIVVAAITGVVAAGAGCSGASTMTCEEFGGLGYSEQSDALSSLLEEHRLDPLAVGNGLGAAQAVDSFCGTGLQQPADTNLQTPIEDAIDWESERW